MTQIIKKDNATDQPLAQSAVLNLPDFAAEARSIILDARKEAARIAAEARIKAEAASGQAEQRGYDEGHARGLSDGYADGRRQSLAEAKESHAAEFDELSRMVSQVVAELSGARADTLDRAGGDILDLATALAEKIVGRVAATDIQAAKTNLTKVLELAGGLGEIRVLVNAGQLAQLREHFTELVGALGINKDIRLVADGRISPGGARLISRHGQIDATIETQLANVVAALLGRGDAADEAGRYESACDDSAVCPAPLAGAENRTGESSNIYGNS